MGFDDIPAWYPILDTAPWRPFCVMSGCNHAPCPDYARKAFHAAIRLPLREFAAALHEQRCDMWAERHHGGYHARRSAAYCGPDRHIDHYARLPWLIALHARHSTPEQGDLFAA